MHADHADIMALKQQLSDAQRQITFLEERYAMLMQATGSIVYEYVLETGAITWSESITFILGYRLDQIAGGVDQWAQLVHPDDQAEIVRLLKEAEAQASAYTVAYRFRHHDGYYVWIHDRGFFVTDDQGQPTHMIGVMEHALDHQLKRSVQATQAHRYVRMTG